jgi:uncharacterized protein DUF6946
MESTLYGAAAGVVVIQSFCEEGDNWADFAAFVTALGLSAPEKGQLTPQVRLGIERDVPVFFLWLAESCH